MIVEVCEDLLSYLLGVNTRFYIFITVGSDQGLIHRGPDLFELTLWIRCAISSSQQEACDSVFCSRELHDGQRYVVLG